MIIFKSLFRPKFSPQTFLPANSDPSVRQLQNLLCLAAGNPGLPPNNYQNKFIKKYYIVKKIILKLPKKSSFRLLVKV